jgi:hypothetical protein
VRGFFLALAVGGGLLLAAAVQAAALPADGMSSGALTGFRLVDATAASVNGEIIFLSDVSREACLERCRAFPADASDNVSMVDARKKLIYNRLILQEQRKLSLGAVDNVALAATTADVAKRIGACSDPCAREFSASGVRAIVSDRFLVDEFLEKRVSVFIEIPDEEVQREIGKRATAEGKDPESYSEDAVRADLRRERSRLEVQNWYYKAAAGARIFLSPMEEK